MCQRVVFLDRDGVINADSPDYIKSWAEFRFLPQSVGAISLLTRCDFRVMVVTNQSALNRGLISRDTLDDIHRRMRQALRASGGSVQDIFFCPHRPDEHCDCRKPKPGMIFRAQAKYGIDLNSAVLIGDSAKDIECARRAGCGTAILVRTGNGPAAAEALKRRGCPPDYTADNLYEAVLWLTKQR